MNAAILNLLSAEVGMTDQNLSDLTGLPLATVQTEIATGIAANEVVTVNNKHFAGSAQDSGPLSAAVDNIAQVQADVAVLQSSMSQANRTLINASARWYSRNNRWYGPNTTYGTDFYSWNTSFGSSPDPGYNAAGFVVPRNMNLVSVKFWYRPTDDVEYTAKLIRQVKTSGATTVSNSQIGQDLVMDVSTTNRIYYAEFNIDSNIQLDTNDVIIPILTSDANGTDYLYFSMSIELEDR